MDRGRRLFASALVSSGPRPVGVLITIFLTPFMLNHLGQEVYGIWALTGSLLAYTGLLALGLNSAVTYRVPQLLTRKDDEGVNTVLSTVFAFYCVGAVLALAFGLLLTWKLPVWFHVAHPLKTPVRIVVALLAVGITVQIPLSVYKGLLGSLERWDILAGVNVASQLLRAACIVVAFGLGFGIVTLAGISVLADLGATMVVVPFAYRLYPKLAIDRHHLAWPMLPGLMNYSLNTLMYTASQVIVLQSGKILIGLLYGPAAVTVFVIPFTLLIMLSQAVHQAAQPLKPATTMLDSEGRRLMITRIYVLATKYSLMIAAPSSVLFMFWGENILKVWVGGEFSAQSASVLSVMTIPQMLRAVNTSGFVVLSGLGQARFFGRVTLVQALISVVLGYVLAELGGLGLLGVALGISIPELIVSGFVVPTYMVRTLDLKWGELRMSMFQALTAAIPFTVCFLVVSRFFTSETRVELLLVLALSALPLALGIWFLGLTQEERGHFKGYLYLHRGGPSQDDEAGAGS